MMRTLDTDTDELRRSRDKENENAKPARFDESDGIHRSCQYSSSRLERISRTDSTDKRQRRPIYPAAASIRIRWPWKRRGLNSQVRTSWLGAGSQRAEYEWYSWIRYLTVVLVAYLNTIAVIDSKSQDNEGLVSPPGMVWAFSIVIFFSIVLVALDGYWDRRWRRGLDGTCAGVFWFYFWLRYPALVLVTIIATRRGLQH